MDPSLTRSDVVAAEPQTVKVIDGAADDEVQVTQVSIRIELDAQAYELEVFSSEEPLAEDAGAWTASCTDGGTSRGRPGSTVASTAESHAAAAARANSVT